MSYGGYGGYMPPPGGIPQWGPPNPFTTSFQASLVPGASRFGNQTVVDKVPAEMLGLIDPHWYQFAPMNPLWHSLLGVAMVIFVITSLTGNGVVMSVFMSTKALRTPANLLVVNLAFSDFFMMFTMGPPMIINCYYETWVFGKYSCRVNSISSWDLKNFTLIYKSLTILPDFSKRTPNVRNIRNAWELVGLCVNWVHGHDCSGQVQRHRERLLLKTPQHQIRYPKDTFHLVHRRDLDHHPPLRLEQVPTGPASDSDYFQNDIIVLCLQVCSWGEYDGLWIRLPQQGLVLAFLYNCLRLLLLLHSPILDHLRLLLYRQGTLT